MAVVATPKVSSERVVSEEIKLTFPDDTVVEVAENGKFKITGPNGSGSFEGFLRDYIH